MLPYLKHIGWLWCVWPKNDNKCFSGFHWVHTINKPDPMYATGPKFCYFWFPTICGEFEEPKQVKGKYMFLFDRHAQPLVLALPSSNRNIMFSIAISNAVTELCQQSDLTHMWYTCLIYWLLFTSQTCVMQEKWRRVL